MSRKNRQPANKPEEPLGDNWTNPFKNLDIKFEEPPPPPPPPPKTKEEIQHEALSKEDRALLAAFGGEDESAPALNRASATPKGPMLTLSQERKGHGGKTVTLIKGLKALDMIEQMELCDKIKTSLGCGARVVDSVLELQGDQRDRAAKWLEGNQYKVKIV